VILISSKTFLFPQAFRCLASARNYTKEIAEDTLWNLGVDLRVRMFKDSICNNTFVIASDKDTVATNKTNNHSREQNESSNCLMDAKYSD
jgi:hypothetical protein